MKINEVYKKYKILPTLQEHLFSVASVAKYVAQNFEELIDVDTLVRACLLHDIGNIIKFNLDFNPEFLRPKGKVYWKKVKKEFISKYGTDEHEATFRIAKELGVESKVLDLIKAIGFSKSPENAAQSEYLKKIATYSDYRVSPSGIVSLKERMEEGKARFHANKNINAKDLEEFEAKFRKYSRAMILIEEQIFNKVKIKPEDVNDENTEKIRKELKEFDI